MKVAVIGLGHMGSAFIEGMEENDFLEKNEVVGVDVDAEVRRDIKEDFGIKVFSSPRRVVSDADIVVLAIKPQSAAEVFSKIKATLPATAIVLSIMAGKSIEWLEENLGETTKVVRAMPSISALVGSSMTAVCRNANVNEEEFESCRTLLGAIGLVEEIPEKWMDAVVGISASSPAYLFMFIEALADAGVAAGMPFGLATHMAAGSIVGSAIMAIKTHEHPAELKNMVCSPGGTTIEAVRVLEQNNFRSTVMEAALAAIKKSKEL